MPLPTSFLGRFHRFLLGICSSFLLVTTDLKGRFPCILLIPVQVLLRWIFPQIIFLGLSLLVLLPALR
uniref:Uncharacterized protein n=1 Tax=Rhizophora mucronata TaxID=61149 RepID=A0A2P2J7N8_RHIMU